MKLTYLLFVYCVKLIVMSKDKTPPPPPPPPVYKEPVDRSGSLGKIEPNPKPKSKLQ